MPSACHPFHGYRTPKDAGKNALPQSGQGHSLSLRRLLRTEFCCLAKFLFQDLEADVRSTPKGTGIPRGAVFGAWKPRARTTPGAIRRLP